MLRYPPLIALLLASAAGAAPSAGIDLKGIDRGTRAGDDFEQYANGGWREITPIPADRSSTGNFFTVFERAERRNIAIVEAAVAAKPAPDTVARRIADFYTAFTDTTGIEARGLAPIQPELAAIAALPDKSALAAMLGADLRADTDALNNTNLWTENLFGLFVSQGLARPDVSLPYLFQGGLGLPDRDYYLSANPEMAKLRSAYRAYVAQVLGLAGVANAGTKADRIVALETRMAAVHADILASQDAHKVAAWSRLDFVAKAPGLDWTAFWKAAELPAQQDFQVWQPGGITGLAALVGSEPLADWQAWLTFHHLNTAAAVLPKALDDAHFAFYGTMLNGTPQQRARQKRAVSALNEAMGDAVGQIYVAQYFPASSRRQIEAMVKNILAAFDKRVAALDWMAPATKVEARRKIATLRVGIGHGDHVRDDSKLEIRADDPLGNQRRSERQHYRAQIAKIGRPVDRSEWWMTPQTVNALNLPLQNALNFPAAILEAPFFDPKADAAANYAAIGAVIGHEISHSFDNLGAEFDAEGRLKNWWTVADKARFAAAGAALAAQYDAYEPIPGLHLNGKQTLGENIADVAGLTAAHDAWTASLHGRPALVIDGLSGEKRFFLAFGQIWRAKVRDAALRASVATDGHAPARFRALTVRNIDAWYGAYKITPDGKLYLPPAKRVKVW